MKGVRMKKINKQCLALFAVIVFTLLFLMGCNKTIPNEPAYLTTATITSTPSITETPTITCTATITPCFAFGNLEGSGGACLGSCDRSYFQRFNLPADTTITKIYVNMEYAGNIMTAIYADSYGCLIDDN